jgi:hypothetical protein
MFEVNAEKPVCVTVTVYVPAGKALRRYKPSASVVALRSIPSVAPLALTVAPAIAAPLGSVTVPSIVEVVVCAGHNEAVNRTTKNTRERMIIEEQFLPRDIFQTFPAGSTRNLQ